MREAMEALCKNISEIDDYIAFLVLYAPDSFPAWRGLGLESAFQKLINSIEACAPEMGQEKAVKAREKCEEALAAYMSGDDTAGAHLLQDATNLL